MSPRPIMSIEQRVLEFLRRYSLTDSGKGLLVAVSGGQDSICMLHVLAGLRTRESLKLHVAHLNHQTRGVDADQDSQYVFDLCHKLSLPVTIGREDVRGYQATHKLSPEEAAREVRYQFLAETAKKIRAKMVAVAHTRDDNVETILLHILRGSGTHGLAGIKPISTRTISGTKMIIIRPLLDISREETEQFCRRHRLRPRFDMTNLSLEVSRNRVRLELLPLLETYNKGIREALSRTALIVGEDAALVDSIANKKYRQIVHREENEIIFEREKMLKLPSSIKRSLLRIAIEKMIGTLKDIEARHIEGVLELLQMRNGRTVDLPYGLYFSSEYQRFVLGVKPLHQSQALAPIGECEIMIPGKTVIPGWTIRATIFPPTKIKLKYNDRWTGFFDADKIGGKLWVRQRKTGDRFQPLGMKELKKVGAFMLDARVPQRKRSQVPILVSATQVVWVAGYRIDDRVKVTEKTKKLVKVVIRQSV